MKKIITLLLTFYGFSFAETSNLNLLGANFYSVITYAIMTLGVVMLASSFVRLKDIGYNQNQKNVSMKGIMILMFGGAALINFASFFSIAAGTLLGDKGGYCYIYESEINSATDIHNNCWDQNTTDFISDELQASLSKEQSEFFDNLIKSAFGLVQVVGVVVALKFGYKLYLIGKGQNIPFSEISGNFFTALVFLNLAQAIQLIISTLEWLGWT
ncbi:hypothetical protein ACOLNO_002936 [Vibrio parahaemolyticus]